MLLKGSCMYCGCAVPYQPSDHACDTCHTIELWLGDFLSGRMGWKFTLTVMAAVVVAKLRSAWVERDFIAWFERLKKDPAEWNEFLSGVAERGGHGAN